MFEDNAKVHGVHIVLVDEHNGCDYDDAKTSFEDILINEVKRRPILWNSKIEDRTASAMKLAWNEIGTLTGVHSFVCASKWKNLRDNFIKKCRNPRSTLNTESTIKSREKWKYFRKLQFLKSNIISQRSIALTSDEKDPIEIDENDRSDSEEEEQEDMEIQDEGEKNNINEATENNKKLLPERSKDKYQAIYDEFFEWMETKKVATLSENLFLEYFSELAEKVKPTTLWSRYSMLKRTVNIHNNVNIGVYGKLNDFLKRQSMGFISQKYKVLTSDEVTKFLQEAPDYEYLATKVALIFGVTGALRKGELCDITTSDIEDYGSHLLITIPKTKNNIHRKFLVDGEFYYNIYKKYEAARPKTMSTNRFFLNYHNGKCTQKVIGINKFGNMPKRIAHYLNLPDADLYTGHSFRRTSATLLSGPRTNITSVKLLNGWNSHKIEKISDKDSVENSRKICNQITRSLSGNSFTSDKKFEVEKNKLDVNVGASTSTNFISDAENGEYILPNLCFISCGSETFIMPNSPESTALTANNADGSDKNSKGENTETQPYDSKLPDQSIAFENSIQIEIVKQEQEESTFCSLLKQRLAKLHPQIYHEVTQKILNVISEGEKKQSQRIND